MLASHKCWQQQCRADAAGSTIAIGRGDVRLKKARLLIREGREREKHQIGFHFAARLALNHNTKD